MDSNRWKKMQTLFHKAADLQPAEQRSFLERQSPEDPSLISEVLKMLEEDSRGGGLLDQGVAPLADGVLEQNASGAVPFKEFGPYRILRVLGEGGMGIVYLAERGDLGLQVAIKILRDAWFSPARRNRFAIEQRTLAQLNHPSIARLYDASSSPDGTPFFVMEYVEGVPLVEYCQSHQLSLEQRLRLFRTVCDAVLYAHQHAVIHRDLKPSNILVKEDGSLRLLDFGIAKHLEALEDMAQQTRTGLRMMTPAYASPEQMRGESAGIQSDVYSLGVILYELLAGKLPFDLTSTNPAQAEKVLMEQEAQKPSLAARAAGNQDSNASLGRIRGKDWTELDVLCLTAMHKDAKRRYASVEALIRDLDHYLKDEPLEAQPDSAAYRLSKFVARNRAAVTAGSAAFVAIVALISFFTFRLARERDNANRQTAIANDVNQFLSDDLLGRGNPFQSGKAAESLLDAIKQASPAIDHKFSTEPLVAARLHLTIAQALDNRSNFPEAREEYQRAYSLYKQKDGDLSADAIAVQLQRASMEARSFQAGGIPAAKEIVSAQEALLAKIPQPRKDLGVWLSTAKGMIALVESDARGANQYFRQAVEAAAALPEFDEIARFNLRQRLAFTYIRLGDGVMAERLARDLISAYSLKGGSDSPYVLRVRLNLSQALMIEKKYADSVQEANAIYPAFLSNFGPDHQLTMQLLTTRAQSEGSLGKFDDSTRDDLAIYESAVKKQGPLSFYAIATLSDASVAQCRAGHLGEGLQNAHKAHDAATKAFGPKAALTFGTALPMANCMIALGQLDAASKLLQEIDSKAVAQLSGDPDWGAGVSLAQAEIDARQHHFDEAQKLLDSVRPVFTRADAEAYQRQKLDEIGALIRPAAISR
ncbi:MAG TPA: serine/threonine-protein kinase [Candidatus Acidoferrum sp.]|nr:serine/threonine-protein kinase [Candidatus Acidoferrum sp.]